MQNNFIHSSISISNELIEFSNFSNIPKYVIRQEIFCLLNKSFAGTNETRAGGETIFLMFSLRFHAISF